MPDCSSSWPQKVHKELTINFLANKYLFVGNTRCSSLAWNHFNCVSEVDSKHFVNTFSQFKLSDFSFRPVTAIGMASDRSTADWTTLLPFPMQSRAFLSIFLKESVNKIFCRLVLLDGHNGTIIHQKVGLCDNGKFYPIFLKERKKSTSARCLIRKMLFYTIL